MAGFGWRATGAWIAPLGILALVLALLSGPTGLGATPPTSAGAPTVASEAILPPSAPNLTIDPASSWARAGNATSLDALWTSGDPLCTVSPVWFHWFVGAGPVGGIFNGQNSSTVNFTGATARSGAALVGVRSAAVLQCGNQTDGLLTSAYASVVEVAALDLENLTIGPMPLVEGSLANLTGSIEGGAPPYEVTVQWGDTNRGFRNLTTPGPFDWSHVYRAGTYRPRVTVQDSSGETTSAVVSQPLQVNATAGAAVTSSAVVAEVGIPVRFAGTFTGLPPTALSRLSACGEASASGWGIPPVLVCDPTSAGQIVVSAEAVVAADGPSLNQTLLEPVAPPLSLHLRTPVEQGEVGTSAFFDLVIAGGVAPFTVAWTFEGGTGSGLELSPEDGTVLLAVQPNATGFAPLSLTVSDSDGATCSVTNASLFVAPELSVGAAATSSVQLPTAEVALVGSVQGGIGPISWVVHSTPGFASGTPPTGWLPGDAGLRWSGSFPYEGVGTVTLAVVDAAGATANASALVHLVPRLTGQLSVSVLNASLGPAVLVDFNLSGGAPPFSVWINASGGASWNSTDPSDGLFEATVPMARAGPSSVVVVAVDRLGGRVVGSTFVLTYAPPDPPAPPTGSQDPAFEAGGLGLFLAGVAVALWLRYRRRSSRPPVAPDPEKVLERILAPADGAERVTVELLAEEAGIPLDTVRSTLARLIATGKVRSEVSPDGEEVLAWSDALPA